MPQELHVIGPRQLKLRLYQEPLLGPDEVRAEAILSGISHGTELNLYRGTSPFHQKRFDPDLRLFVPSDEVATYPKRLGYEWVGQVTAIGEQVEAFQIGDLVHLPQAHRQTQVFTAGQTTQFGVLEPLPLGMTPDQAVMISLAGVALQAIHDAHIKLGDHVVIFGLGCIGLLALQLARLDGATRVVAVDPLPRRRAMAESLGADQVLDPNAVDVALEIKRTSIPDIAIDVSGHYPALNEAIRSVGMGGTIVAAGYYQGGGTALHLGEEWHHNRVTMVSSMGVWGASHRDHPLWDRARVHRTAAHLLASGQLRTDDFITHRIPFAQAAEAYDLIDHHPEETVKVVLAYGADEEAS